MNQAFRVSARDRLHSRVGLFAVHSVSGVSFLMLHHGDSDGGLIQQLEEDHIGKSLHEGSPDVATNHHPSPRHRGNSEYLAFKLIDEIVASTHHEKAG